MDWLNIHVSALVSPEFLGSDPIDRATWICLLRHCVMQENGGLIGNCDEWKDRRWQQICGVTLKEVRRDCPLWQWELKNLRVTFYPVEKQQIVMQKRSIGAMGGRPKGSKNENHTDNHTVPDLETVSKNGKEGNGKEGNGKVLVLPFESENFRKAWETWEQHRKEKRQPITPTARDMQLKKCAAIGEARSIAMIEHSAANGYQGLFEPKQDRPGDSEQKPVRARL